MNNLGQSPILSQQAQNNRININIHKYKEKR